MNALPALLSRSLPSICRAILLLLAFSLPAYAQSEQEFRTLLERVQTDIFPQALIDRPAHERHRARNVSIRLTNDVFNKKLAMVHADRNEIEISTGFLWGLWQYSEALLIEKYTGNEHFREWYFYYFLWRNPRLWNGEPPKTPAAFFPLNESQTNAALYQQRLTVPMLFSAAVIEVLLHELGHIAADAMYTQDSPNAYKIQQEIRADHWAFEAAQRLRDHSGLGRLVALGYLHELERFSGVIPDIYATHPGTQERFKVYLDHWCSSRQTPAEDVCNAYREEYERTFSTDHLSNYQTRARNGEAHAFIRLGDVYLRGNHLVLQDIPKACRYYKQAYEAGHLNDPASINYGWCLLHGHFGPDGIAVGRFMLNRLSREGWIYARTLLEQTP